jgi:hypothetical protein
MLKIKFIKTLFTSAGKILKVLAFAGGLFFIFKKIKKNEKVANFLHSSNFIVAATYGILLSLIALVYRLIVALNWIIQQAAK